jgi:hypothetical protein
LTAIRDQGHLHHQSTRHGPGRGISPSRVDICHRRW